MPYGRKIQYSTIFLFMPAVLSPRNFGPLNILTHFVCVPKSIELGQKVLRGMSKFVTRLNVVSGKMEWGLLDEDYDYWQEIARSRYGDMLHDSDRNKKYSVGLKKAIGTVHRRGHRANVLDIGTGTGLLAMLAVKHGADSVTACEAFQPVAQAAKLIIEDNGMKNQIKLVTKRSTALQIPEDLDQRCNILVSEVFDTELIGEGALGVFIHAHEHLLTEDVITVPYSAVVYIQVVQSEFLLQHNHLADNTGKKILSFVSQKTVIAQYFVLTYGANCIC